MKMIRPDRWVIVEWTKNGDSFKKVLASFESSQSWELSHIIANIEDMDDYLEVTVRDGTTYKLMKHLNGLTHITLPIYTDIVEKVSGKPDLGVGILAL